MDHRLILFGLLIPGSTIGLMGLLGSADWVLVGYDERRTENGAHRALIFLLLLKRILAWVLVRTFYVLLCVTTNY